MNDASSISPQYKPLLPPIDLLVRPLRKRFRFHFYGKKQTNNIEKVTYFNVILADKILFTLKLNLYHVLLA